MITHKNLFVNTHFPVSRLPSHYDRRYTTYPLKVILKEIQSGNVTIPNTADHITDKTLRGVTKEARRVLALNNPASEAAYQEIKRSMPAISPAGIFDSEGYIQEFSGLAYLDYDTLSDSAFALAVAAKNPHTLAAFRSLRGNRIKVLTHLTPNASDTGLPLNAETHKHAWFTAVLAYEEIGLPDPNGGKPTALSALVHDPDLYVNWNAIPLPWSVDEDALNDYFPNSESETEISALSELPPEYHDAIREMEWKEDNWGKTQLPCPFKHHEHDGWGLRTNGTTVRKNSNNDYTFHCFKCPKTRRYRESPKIPTWAEHQTRMLDIIEDAPPIEVREGPSFPHFSKEERILLKSQELDPDAGWNGAIPIWTPKYEHLHPLTGHFTLNGQPPETERHRVWFTDFCLCNCGGRRAVNINRYHLIISEYCEKCHREFPITSYLEYELRRKVKHSITSECSGYLGNDPEFAYFCREMGLWSPGIITHIASAMNTGKTTVILTGLRIFLEQHSMHRAILIVPRISLARFLGHQLRSSDGREAWGVYYEGSGTDAFIGTHGAICCLPSLPRVIRDAEKHGLKPEHLLLAIDEVDFSYLLFKVVPSLTLQIKNALRTAVETNGLVTAGQTEYTLALERFTAEIGAPNGCQAFYKAADPCENKVTIRITPDTKNKHTSVIASTLGHIENHLADGKNVYGFSTTRRDTHIFADAFKHLNPVVYNSYTKGDPRTNAVLQEQKVTDTRLFFGTSAAAVGISIHDPMGVTEIVMTLNRGHFDLSSGTQEGVRNRSRGGIGYNLVEYKLKLPLKPSETEQISLFHEKQKEIFGGEKVNSESIKRAADVYALNSLADTQPVEFLRHHFEKVVNMSVSVETQTQPPPAELNRVKVLRKESIGKERKFGVKRATEILKGVELMTCNEIRAAGNKGELAPMPEEQLSHESANLALQSVGFDDKLAAFETIGGMETISPERRNAIARFAGKPLETACELIEYKIDLARLAIQRTGWLAVHCPQISEQIALEQASCVVETTAFEYPVVRGAFLKALLSDCNQHHTSESLSEMVITVLNIKYKDSLFYELILRGALGIETYRAVKYLKFGEPIDRVAFARKFISENYPSRLMKRKDAYALIPHKHEPLILQSFQCWLEINAFPIPDPLCCLSGESIPDPNAEIKEQAREMRAKGAQLTEIAEALGKNIATISRWCKDIKTDRQAKKDEALNLHTLGMSRTDISKLLHIPYRTICRWTL